MTRPFLPLVLLFFFSFSAIAQDKAAQGLDPEVLARLEKKITMLNARINSHEHKIEQLQRENDKLVQQTTEQAAKVQQQAEQLQQQQTEFIDKINSSLLDQENINLTQEQTLSEVQGDLAGKYLYLLIFLATAIVIIPIIGIAMSRKGLKKGLNNAQTNWNRFQEYILTKN